MSRSRPILLVLSVLVCAHSAFAQARQDPVQWSLAPAVESGGVGLPKVPPGGSVWLRFTAKVEEGWHLYSTTTNTDPGPRATRIQLALDGRAAGVQLLQPTPLRKFDEAFKNEQETYDKEAVFLIEARVPGDAAPGPFEITAEALYQACSGTLCLRAKKKQASSKVEVASGAAAIAFTPPQGYSKVAFAPPAAPKPVEAAAAAAKPTPAQFGSVQSQDLGQFLLLAFGFGLAAIFTPCVFPMIPYVMGDFLNRKNPVKQAALFCFGIVVLFTTLGLALTAALGPFGVVQLGSNPWVNTFIFCIFVAFGLSMLGAFELTLPAGLVNKANEASQGEGTVKTLLMGLTFSLTSFACVGPFVGTLLAASVQGGGSRPLIGMATFAAGLATPFFFLAVFPSYLKKLPKSGGWLPRVKTVMGFLILAFSIKYLSNIDQVLQTGFLTRERFLAAWIILFALPGLYLLGFLRMEGIKPDATVGVSRALFGAAFLVFSVSLIPGLSCQRLGELDAYVPSCTEQPCALTPAGASVSPAQWLKNDYKGAIARAKAEGKLVFINFTGYACTNCHWMKANMFSRPEIAAAIKDFILVDLYTDGTDAASEENQKLQETRFQSVAIPQYAIVDGDERIIATFLGLEKDAKKFLAFLNSPKETKVAGL